MKTLLFVIAALLCVTTAPAIVANAKEKLVSMPVNFVGEWCFASIDGDDSRIKEYNYTLPSWAEESRCNKKLILSVHQYGFSGEYIGSCDSIVVKTREEYAPSGPTVIADITCRWFPVGKWVYPKDAKIVKFIFTRYKGNLYIKP